MQFKPPKDSDKYKWTNHVRGKMLYYGISESLIKRIVRFPKRKEEGIAPRTIAVMQPTSSGKQEVWVMFQELGTHNLDLATRKGNKQSSKFQVSRSKIRIISAWRYPGVSPVGKKTPIPEEIRQEIEELLK